MCKMRYAQLVLGPAGSGKSRYCSTMQRHAANSGRRIEVVNLAPAAEQFDYEPLADVKDLIQGRQVNYNEKYVDFIQGRHPNTK